MNVSCTSDSTERFQAGRVDPAETNKCGMLIAATYRLDERIGSGGMGEVYSAEHLRLGRKFALKIMHRNREPNAVRRFQREARAVARVDHEFVVGVVDCGETDDGYPYLVMDLLRGEDLRALLSHSEELPIPRAVHLVWEACQGVAAIHRAGLVHRDLKPENLFVTRRSAGQDWCKILDFGVAKADLGNSTADGSLVGTVKYMAPEQLLDATSVDSLADIYALGAVLYECLCGSPPHTGTTTQELMFKIVNEPPKSLSERRKEVPRGLSDAIQRALAKSPQQRFANAADFADAIAPYSRAGGSPNRQERTETEPDLVRPAARNPLMTAPKTRRWVVPTALLVASGTLSFLTGLKTCGLSQQSAARASSPMSSHASVPHAHAVTAPAVLPSISSPEPPTSDLQTSQVRQTAATARRAAPPGAKASPSARVSRPPSHLRFDTEDPYAR